MVTDIMINPSGGGYWDFWFLQFSLFFRLVFQFLCQKTLVFQFWCSLQFAYLSFFGNLFSVFVKDIGSFSYFVQFGFCFLFNPKLQQNAQVIERNA